MLFYKDKGLLTMGYRGYSQLICKKGHNWNVDCNEMPQEYEEPRDMLCSKCKCPAVWENMVNQTNGSYDEEGNRIDGYIELKVKSQRSGICSECGEKHICETIYKIPKSKGHKV